MPALEYFLVAESLAVDQSTNRASVFNIIDELAASSFPVVVPQMAAICAWNMSADDEGQDFQAVVRIMSPGEELREQRVNFLGQHRRSRLIFRVFGLPIAREGDLRFEVELNGQYQASHTVTVRLGEPVAPTH